MLVTTKSLTITGKSMIDGVQAAGFRVTINSEDPTDITFSNWQQNKTLYKENRDTCHEDQAEFETDCYAIQDEMIAALSTDAIESVDATAEAVATE